MEKLELSDRNLLGSKWPLVFSGVLLVLLLSYYLNLRHHDVFARTTLGVVYGILGLAAMLFLSAYSIRKRIYSHRLGPLRSWLQAHIYMGIITVLFITLHTGLRISGTFSGLLFLLFLCVVISGTVGALIYNAVSLSLSKYGRNIPSADEASARFEKYLKDADGVASRCSDEFKKIYNAKIRPLFRVEGTKWSYLFREESRIMKDARDAFEEFKDLMPAGVDSDLDILCSIKLAKERLTYRWAKLGVLRVWLNLHVPLTAAMLSAAVIHILSIRYY